MQPSRHYVFALCLVLLASCTLGPDFTRPETRPAKGYTQEGDTLTHSPQHIVAGTPGKDWWTAFHAPALDNVIALAAANNQTLAAARATLEKAQESVAAQEGDLYPHVELDAAAGRQKYGVSLFGPSNFNIPPFSYYTVGPSLSYTLDLFGGTRRAVEEQKALALHQKYEYDAAALTVSGNVISQALTIAATRAQIDALNAILADDEKNLNLIRTSFRAGSGTQVDVLSAQSQLSSDRTLLPPLEQQLSVARHALCILVGKSPAQWAPPQFDLKDFTLPSGLPLALPSELLRARPDILAAEAQLHATSAAIGVATANQYPHITLSANTMQEALDTRNLFEGTANAFALAANLSQPIFDSGTLRAKTREARDAYNAQLATYRQTVLEAFAQVADLLQALQHDADLIASQQQALDVAQKALHLTRQSYSAGNIGVVQVLDAQRLSQQAQLGVVRAEAQRYIDTTHLFLALGGGLHAPR
jgi:NodT family efflux transporter outer membrane factor (OMF) lipoprotein